MKTNLIDNRQIRVFISSTFRDMQDERDYLMKRTFPKLRMLAAERDVTLTELDLRWGITEEESKSGKVVEICLREIENSIPFFIGIIGNRYGWIPGESDLGGNVTEHFPSVSDYLANHLSVTEMEMQFGVLSRDEDMHAYFYMKETDENQDNPKMLSRLKNAVKASRYPSFTYSSSEDLALQVETAFTNLLDELFPEGTISEYEKTCIAQRSFMNRLCQHYVRDDRNFSALDSWLADDTQHQLVVTGAGGLGKSALVANWLKDKLTEEGREYNIVYHFTGNGGSDSSREDVEKSLVEGIKKAYDDAGNDLGNDLKDVLEAVVATNGKPLLLVVDAINQIVDVDNAKLLNWFPSVNRNIKVLFTTLENDTTMDVFKNRGYPTFTLTPLDIERRRELISNYLKVFAKTLTGEQVTRIASDSQCENTLVLRTLLDELINFGIFEELDNRIDYYLSKDTTDDFYQALLTSYEEDYAALGNDIVKHILSAIAVSRDGLSEDEIIQITGTKPLYWSQFFCAFFNHLIIRNGLISFSHSYMRTAVEHRYLDNDNAWAAECRNEIIDALKDNDTHRAWDELPYQYDKLGLNEQLHNIVTKLDVFSYICTHNEYEMSGYWHKLIEKGYDLSVYKEILLKAAPRDKKYSEVIGFAVQYFSLYQLGLELSNDFEAYLNSPEYVKNEEETIEAFFIWKGIILRSMSRYPEALQAFCSARDESIRQNGSVHKITSHAIMHIGTIYNALLKYDKAFECYERTLYIQDELGLEKDAANIIHEIAKNYLDWGKYDFAEKYLFEALNKVIAMMGKENSMVSSLYNSIGALYDELRQYDKSIEYAKKSIDMDNSIYGTLNLNTAHGYNNIACTYANMGNLYEAESAYRKAIDIKSRLFGEDNFDTSISFAGLGNVLHKEGKYEEASECHLKYLNSYLNAVGKDDSYLAVIYAGVGGDYYAIPQFGIRN